MPCEKRGARGRPTGMAGVKNNRMAKNGMTKKEKPGNEVPGFLHRYIVYTV